MDREPQPAEVRLRLLRATLELIGEGGVARVTNRNVARAARVSLGSLTYHFESQQTLLRQSLELFLAEETARLEALRAQLVEARLSPEQGAQALQAMLEEDSPRRVAKLELYLHATRDEALREAALACFAAYDQLAESALEAVGVEHARAVAPIFVAIIDGLQLRRFASGETELRLVEPLRLLLGGLQSSNGGQ